MSTYHQQIKSSTPSQKCDLSLTFAKFCELEPRVFPPVPVAHTVSPAWRAYLSLPRPLYEHPIAGLALELAGEYAKTLIDPRECCRSNNDWLRRCGQTLRRCNALFLLAYPDNSLAAGGHAEAAYAHALGIPIYVLTWRLDSEPRLRLGGQIVTLKSWHWWRAAVYRPPRKARRTADVVESDEAADVEFAHVLAVKAAEGAEETAPGQSDSVTSRTRQRPSRIQRIEWRARHRRRELRTGEAA